MKKTDTTLKEELCFYSLSTRNRTQLLINHRIFTHKLFYKDDVVDGCSEWKNTKVCFLHFPVLFTDQLPSELIFPAHPTLLLEVASLFINSINSERNNSFIQISSKQLFPKEVLISRAQILKQIIA